MERRAIFAVHWGATMVARRKRDRLSKVGGRTPRGCDWAATFLVALLVAASCLRGPSRVEPAGITAQAPPPFKVEIVHESLDMPSAIRFASDGTLFILNRGFADDPVVHEPSMAVLELERRQIIRLAGRIPGTSHLEAMTGNQAGALGPTLGPRFADTSATTSEPRSVVWS
jgi:hypothetical protein